MALETDERQNQAGGRSTPLTSEQAVEYQRRAAGNWNPWWQMWPILHGPSMLAGASFVTNGLIMEALRRSAALRKGTSYFAGFSVTAVTALAIYHLQDKLILSDVLIMKSGCPECIGVRSAAVQALAGGAYPILLMTSGTIMMRQFTSTEDRVSKLQFFTSWSRKLLIANASLIASSILFHAVLALAVTSLQVESVIKLSHR